MVPPRLNWPSTRLSTRYGKSVPKNALILACMFLWGMGSLSSASLANTDCKLVQSELQQIDALLPALESADGDLYGHVAVATGLLRRLRSIGESSSRISTRDQFSSSVQLIKLFLDNAKPQASGEPVGFSRERSQIARSVRKLVNGMQCDGGKAEGDGESNEGAGMATRLLTAAENADRSSKDTVPFGVGFKTETQLFSFTHWIQSLSLKVYVGIVIVISIVSLCVVLIFDWRKQKRYSIRIPTMVQFGQVTLELTMYDLSVGGARLSALPGVKPGDRISVTIGERHTTAEIRWLGDKCFGVKFDRPLDRSDLKRVLGLIF